MIIDSYYEDVIAKLTAAGVIISISNQLLTMKNNNEKVLFVIDLLESLGPFPNVHNVIKSEKVSTYYRNLGNQCFQISEDYQAWQYYNLSLLNAPLDSVNYSLALANRSAVFFSLKKYQECLKDIEIVLNVFPSQYPEKLKAKIIKRKSECNEALKTRQNLENEVVNGEIEDLLTLKSVRDEKYLCASNKLKIEFNEQMGHHVVAKEDIKVGEVLVQEDPYFVLVQQSQLLFTCQYCLSRNLNLLPCENCCYTFYCSSKCKENALKDYHKIECPLLATLLGMEFTKLELLALRTVIKARNDHSDWNDLFKTISMVESKVNGNLRGLVEIDGKFIYDSKYYASIHALASNVDKRSVSDIFQKAVTAAVLFNFLFEKTNFMEAEMGQERNRIRSCVAGMLLHHIMTSPTNMHGLSTNIQTADGNFVGEMNIGSAPYAFLSLINHSCAPNVVRFSKLESRQTALFALRPIKKGMQVFDNYGYHHALENRAARQAHIKFQYKFICQCEACTENWPTYLSLKPCRNMPQNATEIKAKALHPNVIEKLQKGDKVTALKVFKDVCKLAEILEPYSPCSDLADCQETLKQCLSLFGGVVPYGYSKTVTWSVIPPKL